MQRLFLEGQQRLRQEEFVLALNAFRELLALILKTASPKMPFDPNQIGTVTFPLDTAVLDVLVAKSVEMLQKTPPPNPKLDVKFASAVSMLPDAVQQKLLPVTNGGIQVTTHHGVVLDQIDNAQRAIEQNDWNTALKFYEAALKQVPATDLTTRASLLHDMAIANEKTNDRNAAIQNGQESAKLFGQANLPEAQVLALDTMIGVFNRAGRKDQADNASKTAAALRKDKNLFQVEITKADQPSRKQLAAISGDSFSRLNLPEVWRPKTHLMPREVRCWWARLLRRTGRSPS